MISPCKKVFSAAVAIFSWIFAAEISAAEDVI